MAHQGMTPIAMVKTTVIWFKSAATEASVYFKPPSQSNMAVRANGCPGNSRRHTG